MKDLQQMFPVTLASFDAPSVDGRELHRWLEVKSKFADWAKRVVSSLRFVEGEDYRSFLRNEKREVGATVSTEYAFSVDAAKMVGMATKTDKGDNIRRYFLGCEKRLLSRPAPTPAPPMLPAQIAEATFFSLMRISEYANVPKSYAMQEAAQLVSNESGMDLTKLLTQAEVMNDVPKEDVMLEPTELGRLFDTSAIAMNRKLKELGLQEKIAGRWTPTEAGEKLSIKHAWVRGNKSGYNLKWNAAEIEALV